MSLHVINLPEPTHSVAPLGSREERMGEERRGERSGERRRREQRGESKVEERAGEKGEIQLRKVGWMQVEEEL